MSEKNISPQETLAEIRNLMERSSRFISLSGLSGVFAGFYALAGAFIAYSYLGLRDLGYYSGRYLTMQNLYSDGILVLLLIDAALVMVLAIGTGIYLTTRKARHDGNSIFDASAKKLIINLCIPLATGGIFCLSLVYHGAIIYVPAAMLLFYGLALINASKYTRDDVRSLGVIEVLLGLLSSFILGYGLMFWALGFGVMHIAYGIYMYLKYER